jgi:hypothetical protein
MLALQRVRAGYELLTQRYKMRCARLRRIDELV